MLKMLVMVAGIALLTACAAWAPTALEDPTRGSRGTTASGEATAAELGFHGPVYRTNKTDGPN